MFERLHQKLPERWRTPLLAISLFLLNVFLCARLFRTEYVRHMVSIEAAWIALARYVAVNLGDLSWFPLWNAGMPFANAYQPGLVLAAGLASMLSGASPALAYHFTIAFFYCIGPVGMFLLVWRLTGSRATAFMAALFFSLFSPSGVFVPGIRYDMGSLWFARRFHAMAYYGEGPNVSGLSLVPFALLGVHAVYQKLSPSRLIFAAIALATTVLISWPASVALTMAVLAYLLSRPVLPDWRRVASLLLLAVVSYALIAPWMPISTILVNQRNSQLIGGPYHYSFRHVLYFGALAAAIFLLRMILRRRRFSETLQFASFWTLITGTVAFAAHWFHIALLPQPERFHLAFELGFVMLMGIGGAKLLRMPRIGYVALIGFMIFFGFQTLQYRRFMNRVSEPLEISQTFEYNISRWIEAHLPDQRVYAAGSAAFWMNAWTDVPQVTGCCLPGLPNPVSWIISWTVSTDQNAGDRAAEISLLWLRAFGARAILTGGEHTRDAFHAWVNPLKFENVLPKIWEEGDDRLYRIPVRNPSLAHVIPSSAVVSRTPINGLDIDPLVPFVSALENPALPLAEFRWLNRHEAVIRATLSPGQSISVQETFTPGWRAVSAGRKVPVRKDGLGLMVLDSPCTGPCEIRLIYDGGLEMRLLRILNIAVLLALAASLVFRLTKRRRDIYTEG